MQKRFRRSLVALAGVLAFAGLSGNAWAKGCPGSAPPTAGSAAVAQYVEQINTATGSCATGYGKPKVKPLKPAIQRKLNREGGSDAQVLKQVATSTAYGAPQTTIDSSATSSQSAGTSSNSTTKSATKSKPSGHQAKQRGAAPPAKRVRLPQVQTNAKPTKALSAAANVVSNGSNGRLIALAVALVVITLVALGAAALRQRAQRG